MVAPHFPIESDGPELVAAKRAARVLALSARAKGGPVQAEAARAHLAQALPGRGAVAAVWPLPGELDLRPLLHALHRAGRAVLLPETPPRGQALTFRRWLPDAALLPGRFGTLHPDGPAVPPDVILVPLLAFDDRGVRLGHGGGYYDRTLSALPGVPAIGFAYSCQEAAVLPAGPHDVRLRLVVTEHGPRRLMPG